MARNVDIRQLKKFKANIDKLEKSDIEKMCERAIKEIAANFLRDVIQVTPVGSYTDGRVGGTLRRGWTVDNRDIRVQKVGSNYEIEIVNSVEYASYVNNGHRTVNGGWVNGRFFVEIAANQVERRMPALLDRQVTKALREAFDGN